MIPRLGSWKSPDEKRERRGGAFPFWGLLKGASRHPLWQAVASSEMATVLLFSSLVGGAAFLTLQPARSDRKPRVASRGAAGRAAAGGGAAAALDADGNVLEDDFRGDSVLYLNEANRGALGQPVPGGAAGGDGEEEYGGGSGAGAASYGGAPAPYEADGAAQGGGGAKDAAGEAGARLAKAGFGFGGGGGGFVPGGRFGGADARGGALPGAVGTRNKAAAGRGPLRPVVSRARIGRSAGSTRALDQLRHADRLSRFGANQGADTAARTAQTNAFETQPAASGQIAGAGLSLPGGGVTYGPGEPAPSPAPNQPYPAPAPDIDASQDVTPWNGMLATARTLLLIADILLMWAAYFGLKKNQKAAAKLAAIATFLSLIVVGIGFGIYQQYGQQQQGAILMSAGGVAAAGAAAALMIGKYTPLFYGLAAATSGILLAISLQLQSRV